MTATSRVEELYEKHVLSEKVAEAIRGLTDIQENIRTLALRITATRGDDAERLNRRAWEMAQSRQQTIEEYRRALRWIERAIVMYPGNPYYYRTMGAGQFRCEMYEEAIASIKRAEAIMEERPDRVSSDSLALIAMSHYRLGKTQMAEEVMSQLRDLPFSRDSEFFKESETVIPSQGGEENKGEGGPRER